MSFIRHCSACRSRAAKRRLREACEDFCVQLGASVKSQDAVLSLPSAGQAYLLRTFCPPSRASDASGALFRQVKALKETRAPPWSGIVEEAQPLQIPSTGAILGQCVPELAELCWVEDEPTLAQAHCRVAFVDGRFCACDLIQDEENSTLFDGRRLGTEWAPLKDGCKLELGPVEIGVELAPVRRQSATLQADADLAGRPIPVRGGWRQAKRQRAEATASLQLQVDDNDAANLLPDATACDSPAMKVARPCGRESSWQSAVLQEEAEPGGEAEEQNLACLSAAKVWGDAGTQLPFWAARHSCAPERAAEFARIRPAVDAGGRSGEKRQAKVHAMV